MRDARFYIDIVSALLTLLSDSCILTGALI